MLLGLRSINLTLGGRTLFDDASAQIHAAERVGLVGPNGSGKTSLLRLVTDEIEPDSLGPVFKFARRKADNDYGYDYVDDPVFVCVPS